MHEAPGYRAHLPALADPRSHPGLPAGGRVGAADARRPRGLPSAGPADRLVRAGTEFLRRRPHALRDPVEARGRARPRPPAGRPGRQGAEPARPVAGGSARHNARLGLPRAPLHPAVLPRRRVGGGARQPNRARGHTPRLGPRWDRRVPGPDGHPREATWTPRERLHGRDRAVPAPDRVPGDHPTDRAGVASAPPRADTDWGAPTPLDPCPATQMSFHEHRRAVRILSWIFAVAVVVSI